MAAKLSLLYDREGDILHISVEPSVGLLEFDFLDSDIVARYDSETRTVDHIDILGFLQRFKVLGDTVDIPVAVDMKLNPEAIPCD